MSSTKRGSDRALYDHYATHPELAHLICDRLKKDYNLQPVNVLEPGCGEGAFIGPIRDLWPTAFVEGYEINEDLARVAQTRYAKDSHRVTIYNEDVLEATLPDYHLIVGNPPFKVSDTFIHRLTDYLNGGADGILAFILRLTYLGGQKRYASLWSEHMPDRVYIMPARPGFTPDGRTDSIEYMVAVFKENPANETTLSYLDNRDVQRKWDEEVHVDLGHWSSERSGIATREEAMRDVTEWEG